MNEESNGYVGFGCFFLLILAIVVIGSFLLYQDRKEKMIEPVIYMEEEPVKNEDKKMDKSKDFIYYDKEEALAEELSLVYKYPIVNLDSEDAKSVTLKLKSLVEQKKSSLLKMDAKPTDVVCNSINANVYQAEIVDFGVFSYKDYVTIVVYLSNYSCLSGVSNILEIQSYTFNISTGKSISFEELFKQYGTSFAKVTLSVREALMENQTYIDGVPYIQIDETISSLKENLNYILYVDENGELVMKYIVKTNGVDYNDNIHISLQ